MVPPRALAHLLCNLNEPVYTISQFYRAVPATFPRSTASCTLFCLFRQKERVLLCFMVTKHLGRLKTGFAIDSGYERTFSKLPKVIHVQWKLPKQKDFYVLIYASFNQNRRNLLSNVSGEFGHECRRLPMTRWSCRRK